MRLSKSSVGSNMTTVLAPACKPVSRSKLTLYRIRTIIYRIVPRFYGIQLIRVQDQTNLLHNQNSLLPDKTRLAQNQTISLKDQTNLNSQMQFAPPPSMFLSTRNIKTGGGPNTFVQNVGPLSVSENYTIILAGLVHAS